MGQRLQTGGVQASLGKEMGLLGPIRCPRHLKPAANIRNWGNGTYQSKWNFSCKLPEPAVPAGQAAWRFPVFRHCPHHSLLPLPGPWTNPSFRSALLHFCSGLVSTALKKPKPFAREPAVPASTSSSTVLRPTSRLIFGRETGLQIQE